MKKNKIKNKIKHKIKYPVSEIVLTSANIFFFSSFNRHKSHPFHIKYQRKNMIKFILAQNSHPFLYKSTSSYKNIFSYLLKSPYFDFIFSLNPHNNNRKQERREYRREPWQVGGRDVSSGCLSARIDPDTPVIE